MVLNDPLKGLLSTVDKWVTSTMDLQVVPPTLDAGRSAKGTSP